MKPVNRIVLLGASNLTMSLRPIIRSLQIQCGSPSEVLAAAGHGRSYGENSQVFVRQLPGIVRSGLWRQLHTGNPQLQPLYAFLTDIGNDIPYGFSPEQILRWVSWCVDQLHRQSARIIMTNLPMTSIESLTEKRFKLLRNVLFPSCSLSRNQVVCRAREVYQGLLDIATHRGIILYEPEAEWMSFDAIHISFLKRRAFYRQLFNRAASKGFFGNVQTQSISTYNTSVSLLTWQQRPQFAVRRVFGKIKFVSQPSGHFADQSTVSLY